MRAQEEERERSREERRVVLSQSFEPPPVRNIYIWVGARAGGKCPDPKIHQWKLVDYCFLSLCAERWRKKRKHSSSASFPAFLPSWRCNKAATAAQQHPYLSARLVLLLLLLLPPPPHSDATQSAMLGCWEILRARLCFASFLLALLCF